METIQLGHSPDPDDAFMFYGLASGKVESGPFEFEHVLQDIQTLNERALNGELHVTAISIHAYPYVQERYALTSCGSSMGDGYGPLVVAREEHDPDWLRGKTVAVPGEMTSAFLTLNLMLGKGSFDHRVVMFDKILDEVAAGRADAGLIIHEGQLTYSNQNLSAIVDLGKWWGERMGLPLPLGGNCIRRDLGAQKMSEIAGRIRESIQFGLEHRPEAIEHSLQYARDMDAPLADRFVGMYVNDFTLEYGESGRSAVRELLKQGSEAGLVPSVEEIDFID
jgi:1,4-dihydroxy-6-naphthoate synthase